VEEWGCILGEDAFMSEGEADLVSEEGSRNNHFVGLDEVQGEWELDDLVNDLQNEWGQHEKKFEESRKVIEVPKSGEKDLGKEFFVVSLSSIIQPVQKENASANAAMGNTLPIRDSVEKAGIKQGPWSINWIENQKPISEGGVIFSSTRKADTVVKINSKSTTSPLSTSCKSSVKKKGGVALKSVGFMKKIARFPASDRKQIIRLLKKQKRKNNTRATNNASKPSEVSMSYSSKNSNTRGSGSGFNDWENWLQLHGKADKVKEDVRELGKVVGLKVNCVTSNSFNMLLKEGRREWRAAGGIEKLIGKEEGYEGVVGEF